MKALPHARIAASLAAFCALALCPSADAKPTSGYDELPLGNVQDPPAGKGPRTIGAHERAPGIFVVTQDRRSETSVVVTDNREASVALARNRGFDFSKSGSCFTTREENGNDDPPKWGDNFNGFAYVYRNVNGSPPVNAVHGERLVETNGALSLESVDAWIDPMTRGSRLIRKSSLPLRRISTTKFGVEVYAARDEGKDGKIVQFVVRDTKPSQFMGGSISAFRNDRSGALSSNCGSLLRVPLEVDKLDGDSAEVLVPIELGATKGKGVSSGETRTRELVVHLGVSQGSRDKMPVLSVAYGWVGRERVLPGGIDVAGAEAGDD